MPHERITRDGFGLDEIVLDGVNVHLERMDKGSVWLGVTRAGNPDQRLSVYLSARGNALRVSVSENDTDIPLSDKE